MGIRFALGLIFMLNGFVFGQARFIEKTTSNNYNIDWKGLLSDKISETETQTYLYFTGAQNSFEDNFLPRYSEKVAISFNSTSFSAIIINSKYEALTEAEAAVIKNSQKIANQIQVSTNILTSQKKKQTWSSPVK